MINTHSGNYKSILETEVIYTKTGLHSQNEETPVYGKSQNQLQSNFLYLEN